jgi:hypothetical protein
MAADSPRRQYDPRVNYSRFHTACPNCSPNDVKIRCKACQNIAAAWLWSVEKEDPNSDSAFLGCPACNEYFVRYALPTASVRHPRRSISTPQDSTDYSWLLSSQAPTFFRTWAFLFLRLGILCFVAAAWLIISGKWIPALGLVLVGRFLRTLPRGMASTIRRRSVVEAEAEFDLEYMLRKRLTLADYRF